VDITGGKRNFYVVAGDDLRRQVGQRHQGFMDRVGVRPRNPDSKHTKIEPQEAERWLGRWSLFDR
jgi:hypothetical protein